MTDSPGDIGPDELYFCTLCRRASQVQHVGHASCGAQTPRYVRGDRLERLEEVIKRACYCVRSSIDGQTILCAIHVVVSAMAKEERAKCDVARVETPR